MILEKQDYKKSSTLKEKGFKRCSNLVYNYEKLTHYGKLQLLSCIFYASVRHEIT